MLEAHHTKNYNMYYIVFVIVVDTCLPVLKMYTTKYLCKPFLKISNECG